MCFDDSCLYIFVALGILNNYGTSYLADIFAISYFPQVLALFPSSQGLELIWSSVVKIGQSLYREGPGKDPFRPDQKTPVKNFFLAGSYTKQVLHIVYESFIELFSTEILKYF